MQIETVDDTAQVLCEDGTREIFDEVVVTMPLGWLKINKIAFYPQLPERFCQAIDAIGYGSLEKVRDYKSQDILRSDLLRYTSHSLELFGFVETLQRESSQDLHNTWHHCIPATPIPNAGIKKV